jgi:hypothetical protein
MTGGEEIAFTIRAGDGTLLRQWPRRGPECGNFAPHDPHHSWEGLRWRAHCQGWTAEESAARIGRGGGGSDESIPECPVCGAYGGGGHGGLCPNAGKSPEEWVTNPYVSEEMRR